MALLARDVLCARKIVGARPGLRTARIIEIDREGRAGAAETRDHLAVASLALRARRPAAAGDASSIE